MTDYKADQAVSEKVNSIQNVCAIGAGAMGAGTALAFAMSGRNVQFYARREEGLQEGMDNIRAALDSYKEHGLIKKTEIPKILARIHPTTDLVKAASGADFVIESIAEDLGIKQKLFAQLDKICLPHAIFATNTSSLGPTDIASVIDRQDRFVVTHFWNPPHLIPLVEVVPGKNTSQETVDLAYQLMKSIGKQPVITREVPGFIGNRLQAALLREAIHLLQEGVASAADIDLVVKLTMGRRLAETGPLESLDLAGLDVFAGIYKRLDGDLSNHVGVPTAIQEAVAQKNLGTKTGKGIYEWPAEKITEVKSRRVAALFRHLIADAKRKEGAENIHKWADAMRRHIPASFKRFASDILRRNHRNTAPSIGPKPPGNPHPDARPGVINPPQ